MMAAWFCLLASGHLLSAEQPSWLTPPSFILPTRWSLELGITSDSSPALGPDGTIYFGSFDGRVWAVSTNGARKWVFQTELEVKSSPAVSLNNVVYVGSRDRNLYAIGADGRKKWQFHTGGWVDSSPAIATNGDIYFGSWDKRLYAMTPGGTLKWAFATRGEIVASPVIGLDGTIYFGSHDKNFYAVGPDGVKKWEFTTGGQVIASAAVNGSECVYFTSVDGYLYAVNLDGKLRWRLRTGGITEGSPVIDEHGNIYLPVNKALCSVSQSGEKKWERDFNDWIEGSAMALAGGDVLCGSQGAELIAMGPQKEFRWRAVVNAGGYGSPTIGADGTVYALGGMTLYAFRSPGLLAPTPWPRARGNPRNTGNAADNGAVGK